MNMQKDSYLKKILAMTVDKKIVIDQNLHSLIDALKDIGIKKVWDISKLGLNPQQPSEDKDIKQRIQKLTEKTPRSGILFITNNEKHFLNPKGYDVLIIPQPFNLTKLVESLKPWIVSLPQYHQNQIFRAVRYTGKQGYGYVVEVKPKQNR